MCSSDLIHRSNLIGMGVLPLQYRDGESAESLGLTGEEEFTITGVTALNDGPSPREVTVRAGDTEFTARLRNQLVPDVEGGFTVNHLSGEQTTIYDAAVAYQEAGVPLVILAGKEYGSGSSRDWAAKGTMLLGVRAVIAESYERIHRSNLIGMGVLPLQFPPKTNAESLGLTGAETFTITGVTALNDGDTPSTVKVRTDTGVEFDADVRIDTPGEADYYRHGGILQYVLRKMLQS